MKQADIDGIRIEMERIARLISALSNKNGFQVCTFDSAGQIQIEMTQMRREVLLLWLQQDIEAADGRLRTKMVELPSAAELIQKANGGTK